MLSWPLHRWSAPSLVRACTAKEAAERPSLDTSRSTKVYPEPVRLMAWRS